jgi:hypothetical protein
MEYKMRKKIIHFLVGSPVIILLLMTLSFLGFGYFSVNLFLVFKANISFINEFGVMAIQEGAAQQLGQLVLNAFVSVLFYAIWKIGERLLVDWAVGSNDEK